jgi:hypothetical protein
MKGSPPQLFCDACVCKQQITSSDVSGRGVHGGVSNQGCAQDESNEKPSAGCRLGREPAGSRRNRKLSPSPQLLSGEFFAPSRHQLRTAPGLDCVGPSPSGETCIPPRCSQQRLISGWPAAQSHSSANIPPSVRSDRSRETIRMSPAPASTPYLRQTGSAPARSDSFH